MQLNNSIEGFNSRLEKVKKGISKLQSEEHKKKKKEILERVKIA